jgi:uncharacterized YigZ family protein
MIKDTYKTIDTIFEGEIYKEKGSKFIGFAYPVKTEEDISKYILQLKSEHHKARHWCYAWRLGMENFRFRANDDGEPSNSAGQPIYGQLLSFDVTNILIIVVRYYGGTKLGVGGLINAYRTAATNVLEVSKIIKKTINQEIKINFQYKDLNKVLRIIKDNQLEIVQQKMEFDCDYIISVRKKDYEKVHKALENLRCINFIEKNK